MKDCASERLLTNALELFTIRIAALAVFAASLPAQNFSAPPWVRQGGVVNAASRLPAFVPGGALAPGALMAIQGLRFDPRDIAVEIETRIRSYDATVAGATTESIVAIVPKVKESGPARLFVRSHGKRSAGSDITLGTSAFGIFTANGKGWGLAASLEDPQGVPKALSLARPGSTVTLYGTGLGNTGGRSMAVFVGDRKAIRVRRSGKNGIDRLSFEIPAATPPGCAVPVAVRTGAITGNLAILRIGGERGCNSAPAWYEQNSAAGERTGAVILLRSDVILELSPGKPVPFILDSVSADFTKRLRENQSSPLDLIPSPNACVSWAGPVDSNYLVLPSFIGPTPDNPDAALDLGPDIAEQTSSLEDLDAGSSVLITGPEGTRPAARAPRKPRLYSAILGGNPPFGHIPPTPLFLTSGDYRIEIPGGADVDPIGAALKIPNPVVWRNRESIAALDRSLGARLEWTLPAGYRAVVIASNIDRRKSIAGIAVCMPLADATQFLIPPMAVANLPATTIGGSDLSLGFIGVAAIPIDPPSFVAKGLDRGRLVAASLSGRSVIVR